MKTSRLERLREHPILCLIIVIQLLLIVYYNLFQGKYFIGYDHSVFYLQVIETWKQQQLMLDNWSWQTTLMWDSPMLLAIPFYGLTKDVFLSMGISNLIHIGLLCTVLYLILKQFDITTSGKLLFFSILFTPFFVTPALTNNQLDYFFVMFFDAAPYVVKISVIYFVLFTSTRIAQQEHITSKLFLLSSFNLVCIFLTSVSSGLFVLMFGLAPLILGCVIHGIIINEWDQKKKRECVYLSICILISLVSKIFAIQVLGYESRDSIAIWTSVTQFWDNLFSIFTGYLLLTGGAAGYDNVQILTFMGIRYAFSIVISFSIFIMGLYGVIQAVKNKKISYTSLQVAAIILGNVAMLIFCYTKYGHPVFESRYLIPVFIGLAMYAAAMIERYILKSKNASLRICLQFCILVSIFGTNLYSYILLERSKYDYDFVNGIIEEVKSKDVGVVYVLGSELIIDARNMRVLDTDRVYKGLESITTPHHWGDYLYYEDAGEYRGAAALVCSQDSFLAIPQYYQNQFILGKVVDGTNIGIYYSDCNPIDLVAGISGEESLDFFYTNGVCRDETGEFDVNGNFVVVGKNTHATFGPYTTTPLGTYQFTLHYSVMGDVPVSQQVGQFDVAVDAASIAFADIKAGEDSVTLEVTFDETHTNGALEYRCFINEGIQISLESVEIKKIA